MFDTISRMRIEAPTAVEAFALEDELRHFRPITVGRRDRWFVELDDVDGREDEVAAVVRHWLRAFDHTSTPVWVDGATRTVSTADDGAPLGAGDDDVALEHEP